VKSSTVLAFDVGGSRIKAGAVTPSGNVECLSSASTPSVWSEAAVEIRGLGKELAEGHDFAGVGMCVPGLVNQKGVVTSLPGKLEGIVGVDLPEFLTQEFGTRSLVVNDAIAYAVGEAAAGAGMGAERVLVMTIGTGIGVTVIEEGKPVGGGSLGGGILSGHIPISDYNDGRNDTNGRPDTIEALCLAQRIIDYANDSGGKFSSIEDVYGAYEQGDTAAVAGIETYRGHFVRALVALAHGHAPDVIVVGGGPLAQGSPLLEGVEQKVKSRLFGDFTTKVRPARLGDGAALVGLANLLLRGTT
jgi:glucokinase